MPFTSEQFFQIFEKYNQAVFPMQVVLILLAIAAILLAIRPREYSDMVVSGLLGFLWIWTGLIYHLIFFTQINPAAYVFALLFILQSVLFFYEGIAKDRLEFRFEANSNGIAGAILVAYALLIYPIIGYLSGRIYLASPTFGAPCPMTIFTIAMLLWTEEKASAHLLIIPLVWTLIGSFALSEFNVWEDLGLLVAGFLAMILLFRRKGFHHRPFSFGL